MVQLRATPDALPESNHVRIRSAYGSYLLQPVGEGVTRVTWQQFVDPGGALPAWMVNSMLTDLPFKSLQAFRRLVKKEPYRSTVFTYDENGIPAAILGPPAQGDP